MIHNKPIIFSTPCYDRLRKAVELSGYFVHGKVERASFPDGERYHRLLTNVEDRQVAIIGGTHTAQECEELEHLVNALHDYGALRLRIAVPLFGYSTMERAVKPGEFVKAKYLARKLSALPQAPLGNKFYFIDLHVSGLAHYLEGQVVPKHLYAKQLVIEAAFELASEFRRNACPLIMASRALTVEAGDPCSSYPGFVLASTDAGRMKWVESLAKEMGVRPAFAFKRRLSGEQTETLGVGGSPVDDAYVIIYDDMCRSGSSIKRAARAYMEAGAAGVAAIFTHGILPGNSLAGLREERFGNRELFTSVVTTDTHPRVLDLKQDRFFRVKSIAPLLAENLRTQAPRF